MSIEILNNWAVYGLVASLPLIYWYLTRNFNYWSKRGIKGPTPIPFLGNMYESLLRPQVFNDIDAYTKYGKIYGYYQGNKPVLKVAVPDLIKNILVKDFNTFPTRPMRKNFHRFAKYSMVDAVGDEWKRLRSIASPMFTSGKMRNMYPKIKECLEDFMRHFDKYTEEGKEINAKDMYGNLTLDVIASSAFATKLNAENELESPFIINARKMFQFSAIRTLFLSFCPDFILKLTRIQSNANEDSREFFIELIQHIIQNRRSHPDKRYNDAIEMLMSAEKGVDKTRDENDNIEAHHINEGEEEKAVDDKVFNINFKNKKLCDEEIIMTSLTFLLAGYETTATTLTFATYELAMNPKVQQNLYEEVIKYWDPKEGISYEVLAKMPYLDATVSEALRLHSPASGTARIAAEDYTLGDTGIVIEKGVQVNIPAYAMHHSAEYYEEPYSFQPERFLPENRHKLVPYTYLPFGGGPRNCVGMRFALLEAKVSLAYIIKRFRFVKTSNTDVPLIYKKNLGLNSPQRVIVGIEKRK